MVGDADAQTTIAVKDIDEATRFYGGVLGLGIVKENLPYQILYESGNSRVQVYVSDSAGTNKATYATWEVEDIEDEINDLKSQGVEFEHYDSLPGVTLDGDVHKMGETDKAAWFKDPDGNILCLHASS